MLALRTVARLKTKTCGLPATLLEHAHPGRTTAKRSFVNWLTGSMKGSGGGSNSTAWVNGKGAELQALVLSPEEIVNKPGLKEEWKLGREIQRGRFGIVYESESIKGDDSKGRKAATKSMVKNPRTAMFEVPAMRREISMLRKCEHPLSMRLLDVYEDQSQLHLVSDYYSGGELFDHIVDRGTYSEADAARLLVQILTAVDHFHMLGVMHRDLKPENIMYKTPEAEEIVVVDFGMATPFQAGAKRMDKVGSLEYAAPEMLAGGHDEKSDVWSIGVIMFILLSGRAPFAATHEKEIERKIMKGTFSMAGQQWDSVSPGAKALLRQLLEKDPEKRLSASQALAHPWLVDARELTDPLPSSIQGNLRKFVRAQRFKQAALSFIVSTVRCKEIEEVSAIFHSLDVSGDGRVPLSDLRTATGIGTAEAAATSTSFIATDALSAMDVDGDGQVSLEEFAAAALDQSLFLDEDNILKAFQHFDGDGNGTIDGSEMLAALGQDVKEAEVMQMISEVDEDGDGLIDFDEFKRMMTNDEDDEEAAEDVAVRSVA